MIHNSYLVWLNWPIGAFRMNARSKAVLEGLLSPDGALGDRALPTRASLTVVRSESAFLRALPSATHAICWEFKKEWFDRAPKLRVLATPAAGRELLPSDDEMPPGVVRVNGAFHGAIMSETVLACIFAHARGLYRAYDFQREGVLWPRSEMSPFCSLVAGSRAVSIRNGKLGRTICSRRQSRGVVVSCRRRRNA